MLEAVTSTPVSKELQLTTTKAQEQKSQFLQLLVAQLKGQDPMNPMDGTEFVAQLAQFSSLEELINIREVMENLHQTLGQQNSPDESGNADGDPDASQIFSQ